MASAWGTSWGQAWGNSWGSVTVTPTNPSLYAGVGAAGGGGSIDYQVPRGPRNMPEADAKRLANLAELDTVYNTLIGPSASPLMQMEADEIAADFMDDEGEIDFARWNDDRIARERILAVHGRYSDKRKAMFKGLRERGYDWQED